MISELMIQKLKAEAYEKGLEDAWELCKEIWLLDDRTEVFGKYEFMEEIIDNFTPQEAIAKMEAYEKSQKIEVGSVVLTERCGKVLVTRIIPEYYSVVDAEGDGFTIRQSDAISTGEYVDIRPVLARLIS